MKIIIDVDDVLSDTIGAIENRFGKVVDPFANSLQAMFPGADIESIIENAEFYLELQPIDGAASGVKWLLENGHDANYLSSRPPTMEEATLEWFQYHQFPYIPLRCLGRDAKKEVLRSSNYDLLLDDQVRYLTAAHENGKIAIAMAKPWNYGWSGVRVDGWKGAKDYISSLPNA